MIAKIAQGITQHFNASANLKDALTGGLYFQQAPQDATFPYAVFYLIGISHEELMGAADNNITDVEIQFNIFEDSQDGGSSIVSAAEILDAAFHWSEIYIEGYNRVKMQRQALLPLSYVDEIWMIPITYELSIQKT